MALLPLDPVIARLRVRSPRRDDAGLRLEVARDLAADVLRPRHLAPSSILLVRRVEIAEGPREGLTNELARARRQRAIRIRMQELRDRARRPAAGLIDYDSEALLFADDAELMACLALHLANAAGAPPWWCQAVSRYFSTASLFTLLSSRLELLPTVISRLQTWKATAAVASRLEPAECAHLREALARERGLHHLERAWRSAPALADSPHIGSRRDATSSEDPYSPSNFESDSTPAPAAPECPVNLLESRSPFEPWLREISGPLNLQQHLLLGVALGAAKAPNVLASRDFSRRLGRWLSRVDARVLEQTAAVTRESVARRRPPMTADEGSCLQARDESAGTALTTHAATQSSDAHDSPPASEHLEPATDESAADEWPLEGVVTELGGMFLLVNVMEHLGLPDCFEEQCGLASSVGSFGTLEAIARVLAGTLGDELRHDAIWSVLAALDGRDAHHPPRAQGLRAPGDELPQEWSEVADSSEFLSLSRAHAAAIEALRREGWPPALLDWLTLAIPYIGARIGLACGLPDATQAVRMLLELPARVYVTEAHVDVVASIENIRVPIRLAGLDRSPGWVRGLQRIVLIHFE